VGQFVGANLGLLGACKAYKAGLGWP
jgi:hypothetical protein